MVRVRVYRNLNRNCLSVQVKTSKGWRVDHWVDGLQLSDCRFIVSQAGRARTLRERRRNVHAYIEGDLVAESLDGPLAPLDGPAAYYNPFKCSEWQLADGDHVTRAAAVVVNTKGGVTCLDPLVETRRG